MDKFEVGDIIKIKTNPTSWAVAFIYHKADGNYHYRFLNHHRKSAINTTLVYKINDIDKCSTLVSRTKLSKILYNEGKL